MKKLRKPEIKTGGEVIFLHFRPVLNINKK
jgi:hypothetical protein